MHMMLQHAPGALHIEPRIFYLNALKYIFQSVADHKFGQTVVQAFKYRVVRFEIFN